MGLREVVAEVSDPATVMERVLVESLVMVPAANGAAVQLGAEPGYLSFVAAAGRLRDKVGTRVPIQGSLAGRCLLGGSIEHCPYTGNDVRVDIAICAALSVDSMICVPLRRRTGTPIGVLVVTSNQPDAFGLADEATFERLTDFISGVIGAALDLGSLAEQLLIPRGARPWARSFADPAAGDAGGAAARARAAAFVANVIRPGAVGHSVARNRIERVLAGDGLQMVLQPIFALDSGRVVDAEALARFDGPPEQGPDRWFADAAAVGLGDQLERVAIERALALLPRLPDNVGIAVNVGPEALGSDALLERLEASTPHRVTVELTEHVGVDVSPKLRHACQALRKLGTKVAIDDTGTGFASLSLVVQMAPEIIKLDRELTSGIDFDPVRRALVGALAGFAAETGAHVVAEGIETAEELQVLTDLGVSYGQGYFLARPGSVEDLCCLVGRPHDRAGPRVAHGS
ncbi:MAG: sensor domain-containing phosphodiesterase [Acidimicrobiales bacterium]